MYVVSCLPERCEDRRGRAMRTRRWPRHRKIDARNPPGRSTDFHRFPGRALVGRARPAEVREARIQFDSRTPPRGTWCALRQPITRHSFEPLSTLNLSFRSPPVMSRRRRDCASISTRTSRATTAGASRNSRCTRPKHLAAIFYEVRAAGIRRFLKALGSARRAVTDGDTIMWVLGIVRFISPTRIAQSEITSAMDTASEK
ncbi:unnamed protein product [Xylocopa violacea]|uniref:Uncharacterized protein n=1 Tax=Xylocopa violacea TaxID=135666 RepID=A0ABP1PJP7_XYLVO